MADKQGVVTLGVEDVIGLEGALEGKAEASHDHAGVYAVSSHNHDGVYDLRA